MALGNFTHNLCMFIDNFELYIEKKKKIRTNCVEKLVYDLLKNGLTCPKSYVLDFKFYVFFFFCAYFFNVTLWNKIAIYHKPETTFSKHFFLNYFFGFLFKAQNCPETCIKSCSALLPPVQSPS